MSVAEQERPEKFWRDATAADVARVMAVETVEARFRVDEEDGWHICVLRGWRTASVASMSWLDGDLEPWTFCQVYDPPQWFLDKPEPGEGYRLLGKEPDEPVQGGDFAFDRSMGWVELRKGCISAQSEGIWYRRKLDPPKPEPKYKVGQRVKIIGGISGPYIGKLAIIGAMTIEPTGWFYELRHVEGSFHEPNLEFIGPKHYVLGVGDTISTPSGRQAIVTELGIEVS